MLIFDCVAKSPVSHGWRELCLDLSQQATQTGYEAAKTPLNATDYYSIAATHYGKINKTTHVRQHTVSFAI